MPMLNCRLPAIYWSIWLEVKTAEDNALADVVESSCSFLTSFRDYCWGGIAVQTMMIILFGHFLPLISLIIEWRSGSGRSNLIGKLGDPVA